MCVHILFLTPFVFLFLNHMWLRKRNTKGDQTIFGDIEIVAVEEILNFIRADKHMLLFCHYNNIIQPYCTSSCTVYDSAVISKLIIHNQESLDVNNYAINTASVACWYLAFKAQTRALELRSTYVYHADMHTRGGIYYDFTTCTCIQSKSRDVHKK